MEISIGNDHAGPEIKEKIKKWLTDEGFEVYDKGTNSLESVDYPDFAKAVAISVANAEVDFGIIICGSGIGVSIAANKMKGIRAALLYNNEVAKLSKQHNNANVICFGARFFDFNQIKEMIKSYLNAEFEAGRHQNRIDKIEQLN